MDNNMKIQLISDLHLEFGKSVNIPKTDADVLILAGDICLAKTFKSGERNESNIAYYRFFDSIHDKFKNIIYIAGNHEHYKSTFQKTTKLLKKGLAEYKNVHVLDNEDIVIDGVKFIGSTLWANVNTESPLVCNKLRFAMNDFNLIKYKEKENYRKLNIYDMAREHKVSSLYLENAIIPASLKKQDCVVITHHAPSFKSIHEKYNSEHDLNTLYATDMEYIMSENVKLWCHGHTHTAFDYKIKDTRIVCNPHGYPGENKEVNFNMVMEI